jgi:hypothetical protein
MAVVDEAALAASIAAMQVAAAQAGPSVAQVARTVPVPGDPVRFAERAALRRVSGAIGKRRRPGTIFVCSVCRNRYNTRALFEQHAIEVCEPNLKCEEVVE